MEGGESINKAAQVVLCIALVLFTITSLGLVVILYSSWQNSQAINGWYNQAYSAADATQMKMWLIKLTDEMQNMGMTHGYYAWTFANPHNDSALDYQVFLALENRCDEAVKYPIGSMDYSTTLRDIREQMNNTGFDPADWWAINKDNGSAWLKLWGMSFIPFLVFMLLAVLPIEDRY